MVEHKKCFKCMVPASDFTFWAQLQTIATDVQIQQAEVGTTNVSQDAYAPTIGAIFHVCLPLQLPPNQGIENISVIDKGGCLKPGYYRSGKLTRLSPGRYQYELTPLLKDKHLEAETICILDDNWTIDWRGVSKASVSTRRDIVPVQTELHSRFGETQQGYAPPEGAIVEIFLPLQLPGRPTTSLCPGKYKVGKLTFGDEVTLELECLATHKSHTYSVYNSLTILDWSYVFPKTQE